MHEKLKTHQSGEKRKEKTTPFSVNLMSSQVLYRAAQGTSLLSNVGVV